MKCGETKTHMVRMLNRIGVSLLILLICAVCYLLFTIALRGIEKKNAIKLFQQNSIEFDTAYYILCREIHPVIKTFQVFLMGLNTFQSLKN